MALCMVLPSIVELIDQRQAARKAECSSRIFPASMPDNSLCTAAKFTGLIVWIYITEFRVNLV